jgi:hypothetical protein
VNESGNPVPGKNQNTWSGWSFTVGNEEDPLERVARYHRSCALAAQQEERKRSFKPTKLSCGWTITCSEQKVIEIGKSIIIGLRNLVDFAAEVFPREGTFAEKFGVHSLVVRVDHVYNAVFEIEPRPCGMGVLCSLLPNTAGAELERTKRVAWNGLDIVSVESPSRQGGSDDIDAGFKVCLVGDAIQRDELVLVRALPHEEEYRVLAPRSIAPIANEQRKEYGIHLKLWQEVTEADVRTRMADGKPFVLKSDGTRSEKVFVWNGDDEADAFLHRVRECRPLYLQPYYTHARCPFASDLASGNAWPMLHRSFFFFDVHNRAWLHGGSCWLSAPNIPIHGTPDMIMGPVRVVAD